MDALRLGFRTSLFSACLLLSATLHAEAIPSAEAFGTIPAISEVELSPSGKLLAWHEATPKGSFAVIFDLDAHAIKRTVPVTPDVSIRSLAWSDDETLLITVGGFTTYGEVNAAHHYDVERTYAADVSDGKARMLLMRDAERAYVTGATLQAWRTPKPKKVIMSTWDYSPTRARQQTGSHLDVGRKDDGWASVVFEVDTRSGKGTPIATGTAFTSDWVVDKEGQPVARSEWNPTPAVFSIMVRSGGGWKEILHEEKQGRRALYGLNKEETALIVSSKTSDARRGLWLLPLDGSEGRPLLEDEANDISDVQYDRITREPVSASIGGASQELRWLDPEAEKRFRRIAGAFKGKRVAMYGRSEDGNRVLAQVDGPSSPPVFYFVDFTKGTADTVGEAYPALIDAKLGEMRAISYKARDGVMIPAYLTLPPSSAGKDLPMVVLPHGGPESRDDYAFDWWAQFLAVRGYAVLQPQFRGSTGFGEAWRRAGYGCRRPRRA